jgi:hypothetical protein
MRLTVTQEPSRMPQKLLVHLKRLCRVWHTFDKFYAILPASGDDEYTELRTDTARLAA